MLHHRGVLPIIFFIDKPSITRYASREIRLHSRMYSRNIATLKMNSRPSKRNANPHNGLLNFSPYVNSAHLVSLSLPFLFLFFLLVTDSPYLRTKFSLVGPIRDIAKKRNTSSLRSSVALALMQVLKWSRGFEPRIHRIHKLH